MQPYSSAKNFDILATSLNILRNYFVQIKLFSDLYIVKFLDPSIKSFFFIKIYKI